jgi:hypothetical protein
MLVVQYRKLSENGRLKMPIICEMAAVQSIKLRETQEKQALHPQRCVLQVDCCSDANTLRAPV